VNAVRRILDDSLYRNTIIMLTASVLSNGFNYLYQLIMGRLLTPVQYGELLALLSLFYMFSVAFTTINTSVTKFVNVYGIRGEFGVVRSLIVESTKRLFLTGALVVLLVAMISPEVSKFLNIDNPWYLIVLFASVPFGLVLPVYQGALRGLQRFGALGLSTSSWSLFKLVFSVLLVIAGHGVIGGVGGVFLAHVMAFALTLWLIADILKLDERAKVPLREILHYSGGAFIALFAYTTLWNMDMIIVKHYLSPSEAGLYSSISVLGKIALFAPGAIGMVIFPEASKIHERGENPIKILIKGLLLAGVIAGGVVVVYALFPGTILSIVYGGKYFDASPYLWRYALAMMFLAMVSVILNYSLSIRNFRIGVALIASLLVEIVVLISKFHSTISNIITALIVVGVVTFITSLLSLISRGRDDD